MPINAPIILVLVLVVGIQQRGYPLDASPPYILWFPSTSFRYCRGRRNRLLHKPINRDFPYGSACNRSRHGLPLIVTAAPHPPCLARRNFPPFLLPVPISGFLPLQYKVIKLLCRTFASFMRGLFFRHPAFCRLTPPTRYTERSPVAVERVVQCDRESHRTTYV